MKISFLQERALLVRQKTFEMVMKAGRGHLGGSFSCTEILVCLYYGGILRYNPKNPQLKKRDRFVLSKGHANNTLYVILADLGFFSEKELGIFLQNGSILGGHSDPQVPGMEIVAGSLGHGLGVACGMALGFKLDKQDIKTYVLIGDGECQEGSTWEAALFASQHKLGKLIAILDRNRLGSEEFTETTAGREPLADKWTAFGWEVKSINGHSVSEVYKTLSRSRSRKSPRPLMIIANTIKGKGITYMENDPKSHHTMPQGEQIAWAHQDLYGDTTKI